ncbi:Hypothetical protein LUCI_2177 [Lucifera butyrica]|uniref:HipA-like kinase domain-containing protein n=1 Tax=Lucifera butyrica TaxID=1351585 RepID=A0A498R7I0_9FIRM|nr:HipA family kinase [Lucifera butyrica]VBB06935.1 Hypothetical protein LUCI_2177 [Lucifera butyrica]
MLIALKYLGKVGIGVTLPQFFRADDGKTYVVKMNYNKINSKVLANEFLATKFAEFMDLRCFPPYDMIEINEQLLQENKQLIELGVIAGHHFAYQFLDHTSYVSRHNLDKIVNTTEMAGVILFDHILQNSDRNSNKKNLLLRPEDAGYRIYAIDNSHLFGSGRWTLDSLTNLSTKIKIFSRFTYGRFLRNYLSPQDFIPYLEKVKVLSNETIDTFVREIPTEWLPNTEERKVLANHLKTRRDLVDKIYEKLCNHIPKKHGGRQWWH